VSIVPICVECKHCLYTPMVGNECWRPIAKPFDPVSGITEVPLWKPCRGERDALGWFELAFGTSRCGPYGRYFEPKEPA